MKLSSHHFVRDLGTSEALDRDQLLLRITLSPGVVPAMELVRNIFKFFLREERLAIVIPLLEKLYSFIRGAWPFFEGPSARLGIFVETMQMVHRDESQRKADPFRDT